jgi:thiol-disulfide isomerase/thioredoxin
MIFSLLLCPDLLFGMQAPPKKAEVVTLKPASFQTMPRIMPKVIVVRPRTINLVSAYPDGLDKIPSSFKSAVYGTLKIGPQENQRSVIFGVQETQEGTPDLRIDANGDGDLTNDPIPAPIKSHFVRQDGVTLNEYTFTPSIPIQYGNTTGLISVNFRWLDRQDVRRQDGSSPVLYYANSFTTGEITLGDQTYKISLADSRATGDFRGAPTGPYSGTLLLIDANGNEMFDAKGETFDIRQPFNIKGVTYEVTALDASGMKMTVARSTKRVPEIPPPPDMRIGKTALPFTGKTMEGKQVSFPESYRGKKVLLLFWGSWCGDCQAEVPYFADAWRRFKDKGLDFLGISLDESNYATQLSAFIKKNNLPPDHIYVGKRWQADLAVLYGITSIPTVYLVEGDTGKVLAGGDDLLAERLTPTLAKILTPSADTTKISQKPALR